MDLIYMDTNRKDVGVLQDYTFDLAFGEDENDFELVLDLSNHICEPNGFVYIEGTEYGGIIDRINVVTRDDKLTYGGRTWHGILASKVIEPNKGEAHLTVSGEANRVIASVINRLGLGDLFTVSTENSGLDINGYSFDRYVNGYVGIAKMLASVGGKLKFTFSKDKVVLSALPLVDYSKDEQFDNDSVEMDIEKTYNTVNHLICLGKGELENRKVVHLYRDANGNIVDTQVFFGLEEVAEVLDYPNVESDDELKKKGKEQVEKSANADKVQLDLVAEETTYDIGDIIGAKEINTKTVATAKITKKIVTIDQGSVNIQYKVGE